MAINDNIRHAEAVVRDTMDSIALKSTAISGAAMLIGSFEGNLEGEEGDMVVVLLKGIHEMLEKDAGKLEEAIVELRQVVETIEGR